MTEGGFWHRPRYGRFQHAYARHGFGEYRVRVGRSYNREERRGPHFEALCGAWHQPVPAAWDAKSEVVIPLEAKRQDRPRCPICVELVRRFSS